MSQKSEAEMVRLNVFLSRHGICSRREAMDLVMHGRVTVGGKTIMEPSYMVDMASRNITLDDKPVKTEKYAYLILNKPAGYTTTKADRFARKTVYELLPPKLRHLPTAGRLDEDSEGLLFFTNDGDVNFVLTHPKFEADKYYAVTLDGVLSEQEKRRVESGVIIDGRKTSPAVISDVKLVGKQTTLEIKIHEGRKRQIRRMFSAVGHEVVRLMRLAQGPLKLSDLPSGKWRYLTENEIKKLKALVSR